MEGLNLNSYRLKGDVEFDDFWQKLSAKSPQEIGPLMFWATQFNHSEKPSILEPFGKVPEISRTEATLLLEARAFYAKNREAILFLLGYYSLPYCYAAANGVKVLSFSKRLVEDPFSRLFETAQYVESIAKVHPSSEEWLNYVLKFRVLHGAIRAQLSQKTEWNISEWGLPINQEDLCGTMLSFSWLILQGFNKLGIPYSEKEANGWLLLWNKVGALQGLPNELLPNSMKQAASLEEAIRKRQFRKSEEGVLLTGKLCEVLEKQTPPNLLSNDSKSVIAWLCGNEVAQVLELKEGVPQPKLQFALAGAGLRKRIFGF